MASNPLDDALGISNPDEESKEAQSPAEKAAVEAIINNPDRTKQVEALKLQLESLSALVDQKKTFVQETQQNLQSNVVIDPALFIKEYTDILQQGKTLIEVVTYLITSSSNPFPETISSAGTLITAVQGLIRDMMDMYRDQVKFNQTIMLTNMKHELRKKEHEFKFELLMKSRSDMPLNGEGDFVEFNAGDVVEQIAKVERAAGKS